MAWTVNDPEFESVTQLAPEARYENFVKRAASFGELWGLVERPGARPQAIDVDAWVTYWTQRAVADGIKPLVFPTPKDPGHLVGPREVQRDLLEELALFEAE